MTRRPIPIREQTRAVMRALIAQTALGLFAEKGFDATTIEDVAAAAGVSRRTLFNYFKSKDDIALSGLSEQGQEIADRFSERPVAEDVWESLRAAFQVLDEIETTPERRLEFIRFVFGNDSLRAGHVEKQQHWQQLLTPLIEKRLPQGPRRLLQARAIAASAIACLHAAMEQWARDGGREEVLDLYDAAVAAIRDAA
ncbi:TetR family transcriptional regulator [Rhodococcus opacus]|uniref:TetR family transcriptional regulator n=1 Tax=Rhodococcus opacus TaxID=37919 RepID=A0A2S8IXQ0_RHOOP|nr:TetR family transcriptional regulator [Rhodococcus opacus]PQP19513.1 TetR family transcriptional regulator [Rhodococcus opacus]